MAAYDTVESGVSDTELILHDDEVPFLTKGDQKKREEEESIAPDTFSDVVAAYDTVESGVSDTELILHEDEVPFLTKGDQKKREEEDSVAPDTSSDVSDSECFQKQDILDDTVTIDHEINCDEENLKFRDFEKFEEQSKEKIDFSSPNVVLDKKEFKEIKEREINGEITGCDKSDSAYFDSELNVHREKNSSFVKGDQSQHEEDSNAHFSSSNPTEKQDILDDTGTSCAEVLSISGDLEKFEDQREEKVDVICPNVVCDKQEVKEVEERDANGEVTVADGVSSFLKEVQPEQEEKEVNVPNTSSDLEGSKSVGNMQFIDSTEAPDQQSALPGNVLRSQSCNDSKLPEVPRVQPSQPFMAVKPKRRLRPASSVMLKNINILDFDDAITMPKQRNGKRGENEDGRKITQGNITLLRILKHNLNH